MALDRTMTFADLKEMIEKSGEKYGKRPAFMSKGEKQGEFKIITHEEFRNDINNLGTALIEMGLKDKRIAIISENRYEWEVAYLAIAAGTGVVVPLDKALPGNEIENLIIRSEAEAIFYSKKYDEEMSKIQKQGNTRIKYFISMDLEKNEFNKYSQKEIIQTGKKLIEQGNNEFLNSKIDNEKMGIMLFTSGTTDKSKAVMLSHKNICSNILDIRTVFELDETDRLLSFLPLHHTFECTVGFLYPVSIGACIVFCEGVRHIANNLKEYEITAMISVPVLFDKMYKKLLKGIEEKGKLDTVKKGIKISNFLLKLGIDIRKKIFKEIHETLGGKLRLLVAGGAALDSNIEKGFYELGFNIVQGYGLTETSPVISAELTNSRRLGSIGKKFPSFEVKIENPNEQGVGELMAKGPCVMLGYYNNEEANKETLTEDGWIHTGDLARIDKDGYIFISGRKKFVIVLQNGKNVYPEEIEILINNLDLVEESMVYGTTEEDGDVTISAKVVYNKEYIKEKYGNLSQDEIKDMIWKEIKQINRLMPKYKYVKKLIVTDEEFVKTTTQKIKRKEEMKKILANTVE